MLIASAVMGEPFLIALGGVLSIVSLLGIQRAGQDFRAGRSSRSPKPAFRTESTDHEHITVFGQDTKARLEQFEVLKNAGLLTEKEYMEKRKETLEKL